MDLPIEGTAFSDFPSAAEGTIRFLKQRIPLDMWALARRDGAEWVVLRALDNSYRIQEGDRFKWEHTPCAAMVESGSPMIVADVDEEPLLAGVALRRRMAIRSYAGYALRRPDGTLFGTLCAFDPRIHEPTIAEELPLLAMLGSLLSTALAADVRAMEEALRLERVRTESLTDPVTGLGNRRYWTHHLVAEESRCQRSGEPAAVVMLDVKDVQEGRLNEDLVRRAGNVVRLGSRVQDVVARIGGNSLAVLAVNCGGDGARIVSSRIRDALVADGIDARMSSAVRPNEGLAQAWQDAEIELRTKAL
ncbi:MAG: GGDEF domain-containing protein [Gaiellales bacterium]